MYHGRALADMLVVVMSVMHGIVDMNIVTTVGTTVALSVVGSSRYLGQVPMEDTLNMMKMFAGEAGMDAHAEGLSEDAVASWILASAMAAEASCLNRIQV